MPFPSRPLFGLALLALTGCSAPALEDRITPAARLAPYPTLLPIDAALSAQVDPQVAENTDAILRARAAALQARARELRRKYGS